MRLICCTSLFLAGILHSTSAMAGDAPRAYGAMPYSPHVDITARLGNHRDLGSLDFWVPLTGGQDHVFFADVRLQRDTLDGHEINAGLGYRTLVDQKIYGVYGFYDRRLSPLNNVFHQITAGGELLTETWDYRLNTYVPMSDAEPVYEQTVPANITISNSALLVTPSYTPEEIPLHGFDIEAGRAVPGTDDKMRVYGGAFHFFDTGGAARNLNGARLRAHYDVTSWLRIGGEVQYDNVRDRTGFADVRFRIPLQRFKHKNPLTGMRARMEDNIVRDIDIVTQAVAPVPAQQPVLNADTGTAQNIIFVDDTGANGNGSQNAPFNTLTDAENAAGVGDIIYIVQGSALNLNTGILLDDDGQRLIGAGTGLAYSSDLFASIPGVAEGTILIPATSNPVITNNAGYGVQITADNVIVEGLEVNGASLHNILASNADNLTLRNLTSTGAGDRNIQLNYSEDNSSFTVNVSNTTLTAADDRGFQLYAVATNTSVTATLTNNTATANTEHGFAFNASESASLDITATGNTSSSNVNQGFYMSPQDTAYISGRFENNTIDGNGGVGVNIRSFSTSATAADLTLVNNVVTNNGARGVIFRTDDSGAINASLESNTITDNDFDGVRMIRLTTGVVTADLGGGSLGSAGQNRIFDNSAFEIRADAGNGLISAQENWWGTGADLAGGEQSIGAGTSLDTSNWLTVDPNP